MRTRGLSVAPLMATRENIINYDKVDISLQEKREWKINYIVSYLS